ncbi:MAG: hypothetical protein IPM82_25525, partial [Saprospiraceae bacterium]|nr:hypothetical protein [Saprospiraceae bacterium]
WEDYDNVLGAFAPTPDGGHLIVGNMGNSYNYLYGDVARDGLILKADSLGNIEFAKIVGLDTFMPPEEPFTTWDIDEYLRGVVVLPDSGFIVMAPGVNAIGSPNFERHSLPGSTSMAT